MAQPVKLPAMVEGADWLVNQQPHDRQRLSQPPGLGGFERVNVVRSLVVAREAQQAVLAGWPVDVEAAGQREGAGGTRQHCRPLPGYRVADVVGAAAATSLEQQEPVAGSDQVVASPARFLGVLNVEAPALRLVEGGRRDAFERAARTVALEDELQRAAAGVGRGEGWAAGDAAPRPADGTGAENGGGREAEQDLADHVVVHQILPRCFFRLKRHDCR